MVQIVGKADPAFRHAVELSDDEIRTEREFKRTHAMMREAWGRKALVDQNGLAVLPSAQAQKCRVCTLKETKACCEADCQMFRDLVFAWQCGLAPGEKNLIPEEERNAKSDLLIDPCKNCRRSTRHLDLRIMQVVPATCSGVRSKKFREITKELGLE